MECGVCGCSSEHENEFVKDRVMTVCNLCYDRIMARQQPETDWFKTKCRAQERMAAWDQMSKAQKRAVTIKHDPHADRPAQSNP